MRIPNFQPSHSEPSRDEIRLNEITTRSKKKWLVRRKLQQMESEHQEEIAMHLGLLPIAPETIAPSAFIPRSNHPMPRTMREPQLRGGISGYKPQEKGLMSLLDTQSQEIILDLLERERLEQERLEQERLEECIALSDSLWEENRPHKNHSNVQSPDSYGAYFPQQRGKMLNLLCCPDSQESHS